MAFRTTHDVCSPASHYIRTGSNLRLDASQNGKFPFLDSAQPQLVTALTCAAPLVYPSFGGNDHMPGDFACGLRGCLIRRSIAEGLLRADDAIARIEADSSADPKLIEILTEVSIWIDFNF